MRALFGFTRAERRRQQGGSSEKDRFAPWSGAPFGLVVLVEDRVGRPLRVEWDFAAHAVRLVDLGTGADLSAEVRGKGDEVTLGRYLTEIDLSEYRQVYCLDQGDVDAVTRSDNLLSALQTAAETGGDQGVDAAVALLGDFLRNQLGIHASQLRPLPGGRLADATERAAELAGQIERCRANRRDVESLAARLRTLEGQAAGWRDERLAVEQDLLRAAADAARRREDETRRLAAAAERRVVATRRISEAAEASLRARLGALHQAIEALGLVEAAAEAARDQVDDVERQQTALALRAQALERFERTDPLREALVRELAGQWHGAVAERRGLKPPQPPVANPALARYRRTRAGLVALDGRARSRGLLATAISSMVLALVLAALAAAGRPSILWAALVALAAGIGAWVVRLAARRSVTAALTALGETSLEDLDGRVELEDQSMARAEILADEHRQRLVNLTAKADNLATHLASLLDEAGAEGAGIDDGRLDAYFEAAERAREHRQLLAELETNRRQYVEAARPMKDRDVRRTEVAALERECLAGLAEVGIDAPDANTGRRLFDEAIAADRADQVRRGEVQAAAAALAAALGSDTIDSVTARAEQARTRLEEHAAAFGRRTSGDDDPGRLEARRDELAELVRRAEIEMSALEARIADRENQTGAPAALEEELAEIDRRIERIETLRDAVTLARDVLRAAAREAHRRIAPGLNAALARNLPLVTAGRYREAVVAEDLSIQVAAPEHGRLVSVETLSRGTRDRIYFMQRLEMARLLDATTGGVPLLLDDPFARFDVTRLGQAISLLAQIGRDRQVVLFSEDPGLVNLVRVSSADAAIIELPGPSDARS